MCYVNNEKLPLVKPDFHLRMTIFLMDSEIIRKTKFPERDVSVYSLIGLEIFQYLPKGCCFWRNLLIYIKSIYFMYIIHSMWSSQCKTCSFRDSALNKRLLKLLLFSSNTHLSVCLAVTWTPPACSSRPAGATWPSRPAAVSASRASTSSASSTPVTTTGQQTRASSEKSINLNHYSLSLHQVNSIQTSNIKP